MSDPIVTEVKAAATAAEQSVLAKIYAVIQANPLKVIGVVAVASAVVGHIV
jgi:hypothetical protein